ncbi:nacht and ankyrin domain-containing protein [Stemphylium lycopersici]|uniref:Nacht and ankyrin domain-containing protein n=1 Tax=Stemphylium lycopersici TaxID=183478 RepID=A0A364NDC6_STELY|nr:nacht and ankyrin domain-containing protein [Stemphylium lycopersici]RAR00967.1 nacht and ankyrin domain-containing protein [Stemphylium lycopersici]RAR15262.1 nacht and ankyrin domain-containing protein [Stemphylium lycopersici]
MPPLDATERLASKRLGENIPRSLEARSKQHRAEDIERCGQPSQMAEDPPHHQQISGVSIQNQSQGLSDRERVISAKGTRVAGTCEWITHDASYRAWLNNAGNSDGNNDDNTRLLWISGGPGQGKTMMSVFLTEELERHTARIVNAELVFFFCSAQDDEHNTVIAVLRGLMNQIIDKRPQLVRHAQPYFETPEKTQQTLLSLETLWLIFSKLIADAELETIICVLDGLDECEEKTLKALLRRITSLLAGTTPSSIKGSFKLAIVSRDLKDLRGCTRVQLNPDNNEKVASDINLFITTRLSQLSSVPRFTEIQAEVQGILFERAQGTFLWVGFAANVLLEKETCTEILEALQDMPSGLQAMYARMLHQIPDKKRDRSAAILRWVTLALRPLTVMELAAAVGIDSMQSPLSIDGAIRDAIDDCKPFLEI